MARIVREFGIPQLWPWIKSKRAVTWYAIMHLPSGFCRKRLRRAALLVCPLVPRAEQEDRPSSCSVRRKRKQTCNPPVSQPPPSSVRGHLSRQLPSLPQARAGGGPSPYHRREAAEAGSSGSSGSCGFYGRCLTLDSSLTAGRRGSLREAGEAGRQEVLPASEQAREGEEKAGRARGSSQLCRVPQHRNLRLLLPAGPSATVLLGALGQGPVPLGLGPPRIALEGGDMGEEASRRGS